MIYIITIKGFSIIIISIVLIIVCLVFMRNYFNEKALISDIESIDLKGFINEVLLDHTNIHMYINDNIEGVFFRGNYIKVRGLFDKIINIIGEENIIFKAEKRNNHIVVILEDSNKKFNYRLIDLIEKINSKWLDTQKVRIAIEGKSDIGTKIIICVS